MKIFQRLPIYIKIYTNKLEITNLKTGKVVFRVAQDKFSTDRIIVADFNVLEKFARTLMKELIDKSFFPPQLKVLIQQMEKTDGGLTQIEKRTLRDLGEQVGGSFVKIIEHTNKLSEQEALLELGSQN